MSICLHIYVCYYVCKCINDCLHRQSEGLFEALQEGHDDACATFSNKKGYKEELLYEAREGIHLYQQQNKVPAPLSILGEYLMSVMYLCIFIYTYIHIHIYTHLYGYINGYTLIIFMYIYMFMFLFIYPYVCILCRCLHLVPRSSPRSCTSPRERWTRT
jgi:hypothetical protein